MRISIATNSLLPADKEGGPAHSNFYLAKALQAAGAELRVVTTDRNGPLRLDVPLNRWTDSDGFTIFYARTHDGAWIRSSAYAAAIRFAVERSDVCIMSGIFWNYTGLVAARACRRYGVPYVTMPRGLLRPRALRYKALKKRIYWRLIAERLVRNSGALIALAHQEQEEIRAARLEVPTYIIPNGAFVEDKLNVEFHSRRSVDDYNPYILFLGRFHSIKGLDILLPAFEHVARVDSCIELVLAGSLDESFSREFNELLSRNSARDRIRLVGNVKGAEKARFLARASVFALTSHSEGLPVAVLEALAAGLPVVITPGCNLPEVAAAEAGIEVQPDVQSTAAALARLVADPELRLKMGSNAKRLARESFSWDAIALRVLEVCRSVTSANSSIGVWQPEVEHDATPR